MPVICNSSIIEFCHLNNEHTALSEPKLVHYTNKVRIHNKIEIEIENKSMSCERVRDRERQTERESESERERERAGL